MISPVSPRTSSRRLYRYTVGRAVLKLSASLLMAITQYGKCCALLSLSCPAFRRRCRHLSKSRKCGSAKPGGFLQCGAPRVIQSSAEVALLRSSGAGNPASLFVCPLCFSPLVSAPHRPIPSKRLPQSTETRSCETASRSRGSRQSFLFCDICEFTRRQRGAQRQQTILILIAERNAAFASLEPCRIPPPTPSRTSR